MPGVVVALLLASVVAARAANREPAGGFQPLPGAAARDEGLALRLAEAAERLLGQGDPRTEHRGADGRPRYVNRLALSDSPYLRQHAFNPVDWHPWGEEAFALARAQQRPIFLSIGYSTCHWCHVMERESFDDVEIARLLNERFVCIKVDREQRPDVDDVYMTAVQLMTNRAGGWPLSSFLTPEGRPFHGGTYYPPEQFSALLERVWERWSDQRERIEQVAAQVHLLVSSATGASGEAAEVADEVVARARDLLLERVDSENGGFGLEPKFPQEPVLLFLAQQARRDADGEAREALVAALEAMARGGIYDQVGGGFHRYATDRSWRVPHFEKMLYNQAQLARAYTVGWELSGRELFRRVALETLAAASRDLGAPGGGFFSATDADSLDGSGEVREGAFFTWSLEELVAAAGPDDAELAVRLFGATTEGDLEGRNVLYRPRSFDADVEAEALGLSTAQLLERVDALRLRLREERAGRPPPLRDDKLLTGWNGLMVTALAEAGSTFGVVELVEAATRTAERLWQRHRRPDGRLWRLSLDASTVPSGASGEAVLEDYAFLAEGLLALDRALGGDTVWLERAGQLAATLLDLFADEESGGFFQSAEGTSPLLIARPRSLADGATPAGGSVAVGVLASLSLRTGDAHARRAAERATANLADPIGRRPTAFPTLLQGVDRLRRGEVGAVEYGGGGALRARAWIESTGNPVESTSRVELRLEMRLDPGWHVNAHEPLADDLSPTVLRAGGPVDGWRLDSVEYPRGERVELGFREGEMAVYSGTVEIVSELRRPEPRSEAPQWVVPVELEVQICNDRLCLQPEILRLEVSPLKAPRPESPAGVETRSGAAGRPAVRSSGSRP